MFPPKHCGNLRGKPQLTLSPAIFTESTMRRAFSFADIERDCTITTDVHRLDNQPLGARIEVPTGLFDQYPYNCSAYEWMQQLREQIFDFGTIEWPGLPVNKRNYTLAQRSPFQHAYSANSYTTDLCQLPHQDTPPYPTAFWLPEQRRFSATWVMSLQGLAAFNHHQQTAPAMPIFERHQQLLAASLENGTGLLYNQQPGLLLIDNSHHRQLYHARTCNFSAMQATNAHKHDAPMYAFNEMGLMHYIDMLDERRGQNDRDDHEKADVLAFMQKEGLQ